MTSLVLHDQALKELQLLPAFDWRVRIHGLLSTGARLMTMFGRRGESRELVLTAVLQRASGTLEVVRGIATPTPGFHTLTRDYPSAHCFEREMHEQLGIRVAEHPWLKPVRYEGASPARMAEYPFYRLAGKEVHEVAVGPIHAGVIEPGAFRFMCLGETVHHLEMQLGYQHRAVEALVLQRAPTRLAQLIETVVGDSTIAHTWAYCAAIETLAATPIDAEMSASRGVALELERIAMHLSSLAGMAQDIGFAQGASTYGRLRTAIINASMQLCGSRFGRGWLRPGAVRATMSERTAQAIREVLSRVTRDIGMIDTRFLASGSVRHRLRGVGCVSSVMARDIGLVGLVARASGAGIDQRAYARGIYEAFPVTPVVEQSGDCWARARVRIAEVQASLSWISAVLSSLPSFLPTQRAVGALAPSRLVVSVCEGWRGEVVHVFETDDRGELEHYKLQDPSLRNWYGLSMAMRQGEISDFPICNKSFDLSYCGNDL